MWMMPRRSAMVTAAVRSCTRSFEKMFLTFGTGGGAPWKEEGRQCRQYDPNDGRDGHWSA